MKKVAKQELKDYLIELCANGGAEAIRMEDWIYAVSMEETPRVILKSTEYPCGTAFCIAGAIVAVAGLDVFMDYGRAEYALIDGRRLISVGMAAREAAGLTFLEGERLFHVAEWGDKLQAEYRAGNRLLAALQAIDLYWPEEEKK